MFDAKSLLGALLQAGPSRATDRRVRHALQEPSLGNSLGGLLGGGAASGTGGAVRPGGTGGLAGLAESFLGGGAGRSGGNRNLAMGALAALAASRLGGRRRAGMGGMARGGALALLGTLAWSALQNRGQGVAASERIATEEDVPMALRETVTPAEEAAAQSQALVLLEAMISAAKADGHIDGGEMERIMNALDEAGADQEAKDFVLYQMKQPVDVEGLVAQASTPELAAEVYAASLLAIQVDSPAERDYLDRLATGLRLDPEARRRLHESVGAAPPS